MPTEGRPENRDHFLRNASQLPPILEHHESEAMFVRETRLQQQEEVVVIDSAWRSILDRKDSS
jgi:hypothetical protein